MVLQAKTFEDVTKAMESLDAKITQLEETKKKAETDIVSAIFGSSRGSSYPIVGATSDEERALKFFGVDHVAKLIQVNTAAPRYANVPAEVKQVVRDLKMAVNTSRFICQQFRGEPKDHIGATVNLDRFGNVKGMLDNPYGRAELAPRLKAFGSTVATSGDEWVPTLISAMYIDEYQLARVVADKFKEIPLASAPYDMPFKYGSTKARIIGENTAVTGNNFNTGKLTFTPTKFAEYYILPEELNEDSAVAIYEIGTSEVMESQRRAEEAAILNGDNDGTHIDSDTQAGAADLAEKAWKGLRRQAIANSANGGTTNFSAAVISDTNLRTMRQNMKKFGVVPTELLWIVDPVGLQQMMALSSVATLEKYGNQATVITGELARYQGIPIVCSEYMRSDLNASGVYDGVTTNRTALLLVNLRRWFIGMRRPIRIKIMEDLPNQDRWLMASYQRKDFQGMAQSATEVSVSYGYNVLV